ncbi:hypothetical protein KIN20_021526 [Parelaphostrongylus tenuis]|uniref:A-kinase anchor protein 7-like phosphoesterase domain-containing protein n=1 Tax=Parelaphostrongylus tenuis TaxID=148309 RepID=A0AAD5N5D0_PARTN|nr:hypothetical protein KIN20_021526 [Parelaphostrongylus tenuis]
MMHESLLGSDAIVTSDRINLAWAEDTVGKKTYTIGNRVYRRGAYKKGSSSHPQGTGDTPDMYDDDVEDCTRSSDNVLPGIPAKRERTSSGEKGESCGKANVRICESDPRISYDEGKYIAEIYQRKELEESTDCRLTIPRKGQPGNIEIKSLTSAENVQRCLERIELLVAEARKTAPVTHFVAIPFAQPNIVQMFELFKEAVLNNERIPEESRNPDLFTSPIKLHVTVCVLWLFDDEEKKKAIDIISGCREEIPKLSTAPFEVEISGVNTWEDDPRNVKVIFAEIHCEPLQRFCDLTRKRLVVAGFSPTTEKSLSTIDTSVRMHVTLMKSTYADRQKPKSFDATVILEDYKDYHFGTITAEKMALCSINTLDVETGFYQQCFEMALS